MQKFWCLKKNCYSHGVKSELSMQRYNCMVVYAEIITVQTWRDRNQILPKQGQQHSYVVLVCKRADFSRILLMYDKRSTKIGNVLLYMHACTVRSQFLKMRAYDLRTHLPLRNFLLPLSSMFSLLCNLLISKRFLFAIYSLLILSSIGCISSARVFLDFFFYRSTLLNIYQQSC
jgi:hypothetical protein